jgi:SAM-dependent methyltransferase
VELAAAKAEYQDGLRFFTHFGGSLSPRTLFGRKVLDLGCGYGGRTVFYAVDCGAATVEGLEVTEAIVARCREFADAKNCANATFRLGAAEALPYADRAFEVVVSFDVLEHVDDPFRALREIARVLRPGGHAYLVFPTYLGARSSHLDYVTRLPALHRVFDPDRIVEAVNSVLSADPTRYAIKRQPEPTVSTLGYRILPGLNGLTLDDARVAIAEAGLELELERLTPFVRESDPIPGARWVARVLKAWQRRCSLPEFFIGSVAVAVKRHG